VQLNKQMTQNWAWGARGGRKKAILGWGKERAMGIELQRSFLNSKRASAKQTTERGRNGPNGEKKQKQRTQKRGRKNLEKKRQRVTPVKLTSGYRRGPKKGWLMSYVLTLERGGSEAGQSSRNSIAESFHNVTWEPERELKGRTTARERAG